MRPDPTARADAGFAALDALVALTLLTLTIGLSLSAAETARRAAIKAQEQQQASALVRYLMQTAPDTVGTTAGRAGVFDWRVNEDRVPGPAPNSPLKLCQRTVDLFSTRTSRSYRISTLAPCPIAAI